MTQQFLNDFRVLAVGVQDRTERVTKRMPADTLFIRLPFASGAPFSKQIVSAIVRLGPLWL